MATAEKVSAVGRRLAEIRAEQGLTAAQVAERVADGSITKTVITNVETGRKRDLTVTELLRVAAALGVSPLSLLVDPQKPWDHVAFAEIDTYGEMLTIEFLRRASLYKPESRPLRAGLDLSVIHFYESLVRAEVTLAMLNDRDNQNETRRTLGQTRYGERFVVETIPPEERWEREQGLVDAYRDAAGSMAVLERVSELPAPTQELRDRVDAIRREVVKVLAENLDLDYGQRDRVGAIGPPKIDPRTGRPIPDVAENDRLMPYFPAGETRRHLIDAEGVQRSEKHDG